MKLATLKRWRRDALDTMFIASQSPRLPNSDMVIKTSKRLAEVLYLIETSTDKVFNDDGDLETKTTIRWDE